MHFISSILPLWRVHQHLAYIIFLSTHDTYTFINQLYGKELPFTTGVAPRADLTFLGNPSTNGPPEIMQEITVLHLLKEEIDLTNLWKCNVTI